MAPGENILVANYDPNNPEGTDEYIYIDGTSPAAAYVSGVAALYFNRNPGASVKDCKKRLFETAMDRGEPGKDNTWGYGVINAKEVVKPKNRCLINNPRINLLFNNLRFLLSNFFPNLLFLKTLNEKFVQGS